MKRIKDVLLADESERNLSDPYVQWSLAMTRARTRQQLTQTELAKLSGIGQSDISSLENGLGNPTLKTLQRVANGLGMEIRLELVPIEQPEEEAKEDDSEKEN